MNVDSIFGFLIFLWFIVGFGFGLLIELSYDEKKKEKIVKSENKESLFSQTHAFWLSSMSVELRKVIAGFASLIWFIMIMFMFILPFTSKENELGKNYILVITIFANYLLQLLAGRLLMKIENKYKMERFSKSNWLPILTFLFDGLPKWTWKGLFTLTTILHLNLIFKIIS